MKKREIKKRLNQTFSNMVPDVLDNILAQCEEREVMENMNLINKNKEQKKEIIEKKKEKINFFRPKLVGALATVVVCAFGIIGFTQYQNMNNSVDSIIDFDVNPSIELKTNKKEEIIEVNALNEEGKTILKDMDLEKVDLDVGVNAIIGSMLKNNYITEAQNSILVSVKNDDETKAKQLEERVSNEINELLKAQNINGAVLSQMYNDDDTVEKLAQENNVSEGKANLINKIINAGMKDSKGNAYTFDSLSKLSINELNLLLASKNVVLDKVSSIGTTNESQFIGGEKAKEIAFASAGVTAAAVTNLEVELDCDDGILIYEVEFNAGRNEYEYDINAKDGNIVKSSIDVNDDYDDYDDRYDDDDDDDGTRPNTNTTTNTGTQTTNNSKPNTSTVTNNRRDDDDDDDYDDRYADDDDDNDDNGDDDDDDRDDDGEDSRDDDD